jgi:hypothetical protein
MLLKIMKDMLLVTVLFIAMSKIGETKELKKKSLMMVG